MGVDYDGVGGVGIEITDERRDLLIKHGLLTQEEWEEDWQWAIEEKGIFQVIEEGGNYSYSGDILDRKCYLLVKGKNLGEVLKAAPSFVGKLSEYRINIEIEDLEIISDMHVW